MKIRPIVIEILTVNKWSSKFYFPEACKRQTAIKTGKPSCPLQTFVCNISRHLEFIIEQGHRVWSTGSPGRWIPGSLGHKIWPSSISVMYKATKSENFSTIGHVLTEIIGLEPIVKTGSSFGSSGRPMSLKMRDSTEHILLSIRLSKQLYAYLIPFRRCVTKNKVWI